MEIDAGKVREYATRLLMSRMRVLADNGFYGYLLEHPNTLRLQKKPFDNVFRMPYNMVLSFYHPAYY